MWLLRRFLNRFGCLLALPVGLALAPLLLLVGVPVLVYFGVRSLLKPIFLERAAWRRAREAARTLLRADQPLSETDRAAHLPTHLLGVRDGEDVRVGSDTLSRVRVHRGALLVREELIEERQGDDVAGFETKYSETIWSCSIYGWYDENQNLRLYRAGSPQQVNDSMPEQEGQLFIVAVEEGSARHAVFARSGGAAFPGRADRGPDVIRCTQCGLTVRRQDATAHCARCGAARVALPPAFDCSCGFLMSATRVAEVGRPEVCPRCNRQLNVVLRLPPAAPAIAPYALGKDERWSPNARALIEQAISAAEDDAPRSVLADHFMERGDPFGAFIAGQLEAARTPDELIRRVKLRLLLRDHGASWLPTGVAADSAVFHRGLLRHARWVGETDPDHPLWASIESLACDVSQVKTSVFTSQRRLLRSITGLQVNLLGPLLATAPPRLESLGLWVPSASIDTLGGLLRVLPALRRLDVVALESPLLQPHIHALLSQLPELTQLEVPAANQLEPAALQSMLVTLGRPISLVLRHDDAGVAVTLSASEAMVRLPDVPTDEALAVVTALERSCRGVRVGERPTRGA